MAQEIQIFENPKFGNVRIHMNASGEPMFCLVDVATALDIKNASDLKSRLNPNGVVTTEVIDAMGRTQQATFVNEGNLYKCIFRSRRPDAEQFQDWVCDEVLPSIRKTGGYSVKTEVAPPSYSLEDKMKAIELSCKLMRSNKATKARMVNSVIAPMGLPTFDYIESVGQKRAAKDLLPHGISSIKFNKTMEAKGMIEYVERTSGSKGVERYPVITAKGLEFGENEEHPEHPGKTHPRWYVDKFNELLVLAGLSSTNTLF